MSEEAVLERAKSQGYNPDYEGENAKTPEEFLKDGETIAGVQVKLNKKLTDEIQSLKEGMKESFDRQGKMFAEVEKRGYDKAKSEIEKKKRVAVEDADTPAYDAAVAEEKKLEKPKPAPEPAKKPDEPAPQHPDFKEWGTKNKWYKTDNLNPESIYADAIGDRIMKAGSNLKGKEFFEAVKKEVKLVFPDIDGKKAPNNLDYSDHSVNEGSANSELPPEAAKQFKADVKQHKLSKEEQVTWKKQYWGES